MLPPNRKFPKILKKSGRGLSSGRFPLPFRVLSVVFICPVCITPSEHTRNTTPSCFLALQHQPNPHHICNTAHVINTNLWKLPCLLHHNHMQPLEALPGLQHSHTQHYTYIITLCTSRNPHHTRQ